MNITITIIRSYTKCVSLTEKFTKCHVQRTSFRRAPRIFLAELLLKYSASNINHVPDLFNKTSFTALFLLYFKHNFKHLCIIVCIILSYELLMCLKVGY